MFIRRKESKSSLENSSQHSSSQYDPSQYASSQYGRARSRAASSVSSDNGRQKAEQVQTVLASLGPMLGPAPPRASIKSESTRSGPGEGYRRPRQDSRSHLPPAPWDRGHSGKVVAKVDPDEEFCSFPRIGSPSLRHSPNHESDYHRSYTTSPTVSRAKDVQPPPMSSPNVLRKDPARSIPRMGSVEMLSSRGIHPPENHLAPSHSPTSPHEAASGTRFRSKSVGAAQQRARQAIEHVPAVPAPSPLAPSPRASPRSPRPPRPARSPSNLSALFSEGGWTDDDPFARLPPDSAAIQQRVESPESSGSTSPISPINSSMKGKKSMSNMEGARKKFLVTEEDLETTDPSWPANRLNSQGSSAESRTHGAHAPWPLGRSLSADASGILGTTGTAGKDSVVSPPRGTNSFPMLSRHGQQSFGSSGAPSGSIGYGSPMYVTVAR